MPDIRDKPEICHIDEVGSWRMTKRKTAKPAEAMEAARVAERRLHETLATAKQLKAKSRDAKRRMKAAKKVAKKAAKEARAARKLAQEARREYKKAVARVSKARAKAAKSNKEVKIVTPNRKSPSRNHTPARRAGRGSERARRRVWEVGEDAADNGSRAGGDPESATAS
jgi:chromosome segregation ATPase